MINDDRFNYLTGDDNDTKPNDSPTAKNAEASLQDSRTAQHNEGFSQETTNATNEKKTADIQQEAKAVNTLNVASTAQVTKNNRKIFNPRSDEEISEHNEPIQYLIKDYIRKKGLHMLYGESGCGKGFCILDMCEAISRPEIISWHGKTIKHGDVIYFCGESADGLNARIRVWKNTRGVTEKNTSFCIDDTIFHLDETDKNSDYYIDNVIAYIKGISDNPALVVIDTVNIYMRGDENKATDTGYFLSACRKIIDACGCAVLLVQHVGLSTDAKNRARGSSAFFAGMDIVMQLKKDNDILTLSVKKNKEGKLPQDLLFNLIQHDIPEWVDDDGEPITSCTIELAERLMQYREAIQAEKKKPKLKPAQQFAVDSFREAAKLHGKIITDNTETGHESIRLEDSKWRDYIFEKLPSTNEDPKKDNGNKRVKFCNAKKYMTLEAHILTIQREEGREYYCLDLSGDTSPAYRLEIRTAIKNREKAEAGKSAKTNEASTAGEGNTTQNLF